MSDEDRWYWATGDVIAGIGAVICFISIYIAAVSSVGWVVGIALGWIPAYLGAALCGLLLRFLWLPLLLVIVGGLAMIFGWVE